MSPTWAYRTFDQYLNDIRVYSPVRVIYNRQTLEVTGVISPIYSAEDAPKPAPGDLTAEAAQALANQELTNRFGHEDIITASAPELVYGDLDGQLTLGWTMTLRRRGAPFSAFVDAKTGKGLVRSTGKPTRTCTANGSGAMECTDIQTTLVIGSDGQCLNACGSPMEAAHREAVRLFEEALSRYKQLGFSGDPNNFDPDVEIVTDSTGLQPSSLAETHVDPSDYETRIVVRDMNLGTDPEIMYHETGHYFANAKNDMFSLGPGYTPGEAALDESIAYVLDEISRGTIADLQHPNAHITSYVDTFPSAADNAQILAQAFYKWISTPNSTNIQMAEKILLRAISLMSPCSGSACLDLADPVRDVLDMMDDADEITGPQETAIKNDFYAAMGSVGLGHLAQPPGGTPPPPPPIPSAPFLTHPFYGCNEGVGLVGVVVGPGSARRHLRGLQSFRDLSGNGHGTARLLRRLQYECGRTHSRLWPGRMQLALQLSSRKRHMRLRRLRDDSVPIEQLWRAAARLIKVRPRLGASVLLMHVSSQALASETLKFVQEWRVAQGTHVVVVFDDGATYHSLVPNDSSAPAACSDPRLASLSLLTSYDYASLRRKGELEMKLDSTEVARRWRVVVERPVQYVPTSDSSRHGTAVCTFAVVGKPIEQLTELRLVRYDSIFLRRPSEFFGTTRCGNVALVRAQRTCSKGFGGIAAALTTRTPGAVATPIEN